MQKFVKRDNFLFKNFIFEMNISKKVHFKKNVKNFYFVFPISPIENKFIKPDNKRGNRKYCLNAVKRNDFCLSVKLFLPILF